MRKLAWLLPVCAVTALSLSLHAQQTAADIVLFNGKIITVDDRFSIAQAIAVRGDRILAVGSNADINRLAGAGTQRIDLKGRSVVPGFIDNHAHFQEEGAYWTLELRFDDVETRKQALEMIRAKAKEVGPGKWVFNLGGFSPDQLTDNKKPFTREELDQVAPDNRREHRRQAQRRHCASWSRVTACPASSTSWWLVKTTQPPRVSCRARWA